MLYINSYDDVVSKNVLKCPEKKSLGVAVNVYREKKRMFCIKVIFLLSFFLLWLFHKCLFKEKLRSERENCECVMVFVCSVMCVSVHWVFFLLMFHLYNFLMEGHSHCPMIDS